LTEVNEEIVKQYLEMMGFFVRTDIPYFRPMSKTGLKSSGWGDLDILAVGPDKERYLVQVKGWHTEAFTPSYFGGTPWVDTLAKKEAARVFESNEFKTILVVSGIGSRSENEVRRLAKAEGIDEIWLFREIIAKLIDYVQVNPNYDSEVLQTIRLLKVYGFLKPVASVSQDRP
jgi:hypothetical protein